MITPHQVAARLTFGPLPVGSTLMHDCDVRVCVSTAPGHVRVATQAENMWQAARRGRAAGPRPGLVDVRGKVGASRAVQDAIKNAGTDDRQLLGEVLAACLAAGDPLRTWVPMFDLPAGTSKASVAPWDDFPADLFAVPRQRPARTPGDAPSLFATPSAAGRRTAPPKHGNAPAAGGQRADGDRTGLAVIGRPLDFPPGS